VKWVASRAGLLAIVKAGYSVLKWAVLRAVLLEDSRVVSTVDQSAISTVEPKGVKWVASRAGLLAIVKAGYSVLKWAASMAASTVAWTAASRVGL